MPVNLKDEQKYDTYYYYVFGNDTQRLKLAIDQCKKKIINNQQTDYYINRFRNLQYIYRINYVIELRNQIVLQLRQHTEDNIYSILNQAIKLLANVIVETDSLHTKAETIEYYRKTLINIVDWVDENPILDPMDALIATQNEQIASRFLAHQSIYDLFNDQQMEDYIDKIETSEYPNNKLVSMYINIARINLLQHVLIRNLSLTWLKYINQDTERIKKYYLQKYVDPDIKQYIIKELNHNDN